MLESAVDGAPNGHMLGVQVKSGARFFAKTVTLNERGSSLLVVDGFLSDV